MTPEEWDQLARRSRNVFGTREWLSTWLEHNPSDAAFTVASRRADGSLAGLLPLDVASRRPTVLRPLGPWPPPERPLIAADEDADTAVRDVMAQLDARAGWDVLQLDAVPCGQAWGTGRRSRVLAREPDRVVHLDGRSWDDVLKGASRNSRKSIRRWERRLQERYDVRYRCADASTLSADVDLFLKLHWMRWGAETNVLTPDRKPFLQDFAAHALARGWLFLRFLELDGEPVAAGFNLRFENIEVFFMLGMNPSWRHESVGLALAHHGIARSAAAGMQEFHYLRGSQPYKDRLPNEDRPVAHVAVPGTAVGALTVAAWGAKRRVRLAAERSELPRRLASVIRRSARRPGGRNRSAADMHQ